LFQETDMATTFDPYGGEELGAAGQRLREDSSRAASHITNVAGDEIKNLIADVEDLVARLADLNDADIASLRNKVMSTVGIAKERLAEGADTVKRRAQRAFSGADDYVRESPWVAIGLAAAVGAVAGILVARRS
jgi:ElaB protein